MGTTRFGVLAAVVLAGAACAGAPSAIPPPPERPAADAEAPGPTPSATTSVTLPTTMETPGTAPPATAPATLPQDAPGEPACLLRFGPPEHLLGMSGSAEPFLSAGDFDGDGDPDIVVTRLRFQTTDTFPLEVYLQDGGRLVPATPGIFVGPVPTVQHPAERIVADFNGDGVDDVFVPDTGRDLHPFPGYQNPLALSAPGGSMVDGTPGLPGQRDYSHSAEAGDVDGDGDLDLYVGNVWGGEDVGPQIWLNDGAGRFLAADHLLPDVIADRDYGAYLTEVFADLDGDGDLDLVLGDAGDDLSRGPDSEVLRNDGTGRFSLVPGAVPPKRAPGDLVHDIEAADLDGDGSPDLVAVAQRGGGGSYLQVLRNRGDGHFDDVTDEWADPVPRTVWIPRIDLIDLDGDGDLDLIARPWDDRRPDPILWINDGRRFTLTPYDFGLDYLYYDFVDWDGDGDLDIIQAGFSVLLQRPCA